jgi:hypothetical protein
MAANDSDTKHFLWEREGMKEYLDDPFDHVLSPDLI